MQVAFSKRSQSIPVRILKWVIIIAVVYYGWETRWLWISLLVAFILSLTLHFWIRYKTKGWTQSYGLWKHEDDEKV